MHKKGGTQIKLVQDLKPVQVICIIFVTLTCFHLTYFFREEKCSRLKTKWPFHFQKRTNFLVKLHTTFSFRKKTFISHEEGSTLIFSSHKRIRQMKAFKIRNVTVLQRFHFLYWFGSHNNIEKGGTPKSL